MKGNLSTEGLYEETKRKRSFSQLSQVRRANSILELQADHQAQSPGLQHSLVEPDHESVGTQATLPPNQQAYVSELEPASFSRRKRVKRTRAGTHEASTQPAPPGVKLKASQSSSRPTRIQSQEPTVSIVSAALKSTPVDTAPLRIFKSALWIRPEGIGTDGGPVIAYYDESCPYSLISKTAALHLGLKLVPCRPRLQLSISTPFGIVKPKEYVSCHIEIPWEKHRDLGRRDIAVAEGVLESRGIQFLAGNRILQTTGRPPMKNSRNASDYLRPGMGTRVQSAASYPEAAFSSHERSNSSLDQAFHDDGFTSFKCVTEGDQATNYNRTEGFNDPSSESAYNQDAAQSTGQRGGIELLTAPPMSFVGLMYPDSHTPLPIATASSRISPTISPETCVDPPHFDARGTRRIPSPSDDATGRDPRSQPVSSCTGAKEEPLIPSIINQAFQAFRESNESGLKQVWNAFDADQFDDGKPAGPTSFSSKSKASAWTDARSTDSARAKESEEIDSSKATFFDEPLNEVSQGGMDLTGGSLDRLQRLAGQHERLLCLISEIKHSNPVSMALDYDSRTFLSDHVKIGVEDLTHHKWDWWPLAEPSRPLKGDEVRLEWTCVGIPIQSEHKMTRTQPDEEQSCGKTRTDNVPREFGHAMVDFVRQGYPGAVNPSAQAAPATFMQGTNSRGNTSNAGISNIPIDAVDASKPNTVDVQNNIDITGSGSPQRADSRAKHIFLVVSCGSLQLHQIISTAQCTITFSDNLRRGYRQLRGFWRYWLSIYKFSHCDFFEFEKFCSSRISDIKKGLPPDESPYTEDYFYTPRPSRSNSPISPKEFEHIFYHYRKTTTARINAWYQPFTVMGQAPFYWPRFFKQLPPLFQKQIDGNLPSDTVPKIPQRLSHFDELSNNRETFWGLHAREQISAVMVSIYTLLALMPWFAFCFVYIFGLGSNEVDIQNATTPLTISLTTVSLFIAWLVKH